MANAGFHFCPLENEFDRVECACCQLNLEGWEEGDLPFKEHQNRRPRCAFVKSHPPATNCSSVGMDVHDQALMAEEPQSAMAIDTLCEPIANLRENQENVPLQDLDSLRVLLNIKAEIMELKAISEIEKEMTVIDFLKARQESAKAHLDSECQRMMALLEKAGSQICGQMEL